MVPLFLLSFFPDKSAEKKIYARFLCPSNGPSGTGFYFFPVFPAVPTFPPIPEEVQSELTVRASMCMYILLTVWPPQQQ